MAPPATTSKDGGGKDGSSKGPPKARPVQKSVKAKEKESAMDVDETPEVRGQETGSGEEETESGSEHEAEPQPTQPVKQGRGGKKAAGGKAKGGKKKKELAPVALADATADAGDLGRNLQKLQEAVKHATIGYARLNTADPPHPKIALQFGELNARPINPLAVTRLHKDFILSGRNPVQEPMYILVKRDWVDRNSLSTDPSTPWSVLQPVQFTVKAYGQTVHILNGNHRTQAAIKLRQDFIKDRLQKEKDREDSLHDDLKDRVKDLNDLLTLLDQQIEESVQWLVAVLDMDLTDDATREHLARNYSNPTHGPTQEEELMRLIRRVNAKIAELSDKLAAHEVPRPGTPQWDTQVLQKLVTSLQRKNYSYSTVLHTAPGVELVRNMDKFAFFRGEGVIRVKDLQALLVGANRARGDVSAIGAFWAKIINEGFDVLSLVSRTAVMSELRDPSTVIMEYPPPDPQFDRDPQLWKNINPRHLPWINFIRASKKLDLLVSSDVRRDEEVPAQIEDEATWRRVQDRQAAQVAVDLETEVKRLGGGHHVRSLWSSHAVRQLDKAYINHVQPFMARHFARFASPEWRDAMAAYHAEVKKGLDALWSDRRRFLVDVAAQLRQAAEDEEAEAAAAREAAGGDNRGPAQNVPANSDSPTVEHELLALRYATAKLDMVFALQEHGFRRNMPLPSPAFISDLKTTLEGFEHSIRWLSRTLDPFAETFVRSTTDAHAVFCHCSYIVAKLQDDKFFQDPSANEEKFWDWLYNNLDLIREVEPFLLEFVTDEMLQIWSLTPAKWQKAVKKFPHDPATPLTSFDVVSEAGVECVALSAKELQTVNSIRPWISLAMDSRANVRPQDADLHSLRQTPAGHIFPTTRAKQWQPYVNMKYFDKNPVTASVREVPTPDLDKYPVLAMMYRHPGWLSRTFPSGKLHAATMYACLCVVEQRLAIATTGRLMLLDCGRSLFHSFTKFLSSIAKPAHTKRRKNVPWAASPEDNVRTWIPWDDALRESFQQQAAAQFPPPDMSLSGDERIHAVKRMRRYRAELADLRKRLEGSLCAQSAPHGTGFVQYHVACAFDRLVMALMGNIHRIEARMRGLPVEAPYVFIDVPPLQPFYVEYRAGPSVSEPTVFMDSDEIHERNPHLFDQYITLAFAEGWPLLDGQDDTWPLPQQLKGWPTVLGTTREETVRAALHEYELASKKTLLSAHKSRTFADPPPGPVRAFDDETFTLLHPKVEPFKEEDVKDCAQVRKLLGLPADADLDRNAAKGDQDVNMTELSGSKGKGKQRAKTNDDVSMHDAQPQQDNPPSPAAGSGEQIDALSAAAKSPSADQDRSAPEHANDSATVNHGPRKKADRQGTAVAPASSRTLQLAPHPTSSAVVTQKLSDRETEAVEVPMISNDEDGEDFELRDDPEAEEDEAEAVLPSGNRADVERGTPPVSPSQRGATTRSPSLLSGQEDVEDEEESPPVITRRLQRNQRTRIPPSSPAHETSPVSDRLHHRQRASTRDSSPEDGAGSAADDDDDGISNSGVEDREMEVDPPFTPGNVLVASSSQVVAQSSQEVPLIETLHGMSGIALDYQSDGEAMDEELPDAVANSIADEPSDVDMEPVQSRYGLRSRPPVFMGQRGGAPSKVGGSRGPSTAGSSTSKGKKRERSDSAAHTKPADERSPSKKKGPGRGAERGSRARRQSTSDDDLSRAKSLHTQGMAGPGRAV